jgi:hypothetical protein
MLLSEMFSPIGAPKDNEQDIDWMGDLKFFIDNDEKMLGNYFFPAVKKHKEHKGNPNAYKLYMHPLESCLNHYKEKFQIEEAEEKFPKDKLIELAKKIAEEQERFMENGDYETE